MPVAPEREPGDAVERGATLEGADELAEGEVPFAAHDEVHPARRRRVDLRREAGVVAADHDRDAGSEHPDEIDDLERRPALEGHHREAYQGRLVIGHQSANRAGHVVLRQHEIGHRDVMVRIEVARKGRQGAVRHAHRH